MIKSPGPSGIPAELFKKGGEIVLDRMHKDLPSHVGKL